MSCYSSLWALHAILLTSVLIQFLLWSALWALRPYLDGWVPKQVQPFDLTQVDSDEDVKSSQTSHMSLTVRIWILMLMGYFLILLFICEWFLNLGFWAVFVRYNVDWWGIVYLFFFFDMSFMSKKRNHKPWLISSLAHASKTNSTSINFSLILDILVSWIRLMEASRAEEECALLSGVHWSIWHTWWTSPSVLVSTV